MKIWKQVIPIATIILSCVCDGYGQIKDYRQDSTSNQIIYFRFDRAVVDSGYMANGDVLRELGRILNDDATLSTIDSISITSRTSPDGHPDYNKKLGVRRANALKGYIVWKHPNVNQHIISARYSGEDWSGLRELIESDDNVPGKSEVLKVIDQQVNSMTKEWRLKQIKSGAAWRYIVHNLLRRLRTGTTVIVYRQPIVQPESEVLADTLPAKTEVDTIASVAVEPTVVLLETISTPEPKTIFAVKTNLAAYAAVVANLGVEIPLSKHFSIDLPVYYSPYTISDTYKFRILAAQPELRYWPRQSMKGHFVGLHLMGGWYNIAFDARNRYQDTEGNSPFYGGGLSYGYALNFGKHWGMEFTLGVGYLYLNYDLFYNVDNGARFDRKRLHYWGPTKLGINLIYRFQK